METLGDTWKSMESSQLKTRVLATSRFRIQGKKFFLTYPQCEKTMEDAMGSCKEVFDDTAIIVVAQEKHETGEHHLHVYVETEQKRTITSANALDIIGDKHGNYKTVGKTIQDKIRTLRYVVKDGKYLQHNIEVEKVITDSKKVHTKGRKSIHEGEGHEIVKKIMEGVSYDTILKEYPYYCLVHGRKVKEFIADWEDRREHDEEPEIVEDRPWQQELLKEIKQTPDPRKVIWYVDTVGNTGKSTIRTHLVRHENAYYATGKCQDMYYAYKKQPVVIFDIPRTSEEYVNYTAIEEFKNGMVFSTKYESKVKAFKKPHVVVFANFYPNTEALS